MELQEVPGNKQMQCWGSLKYAWEVYAMHNEQSPVCDIWQDPDRSDPAMSLVFEEPQYFWGSVGVW
jgi:hypothetical protein